MVFSTLFHERKSKWKVHSTKVSPPRRFHSVTAINEDKMIIIGGMDEDGVYLNTVELYDIKKTKNAITKLPNMQRARAGHSSVMLNNYIYIIGGCDDSSDHTSVHRLDLSQIINSSTSSLCNDWETSVIPDIIGMTCFPTAVVYDEYIYLFGISNGIRYKPPSSVSDSSPAQNWEPIASMREERYNFAAVKNGDRIYIIGGRRDNSYLDSMEIYDQSSNTFEDGSILPIEMAGMTAVSVGNYIIINGGLKSNEYFNTKIFLFDTVSKEWRIIHSPSIKTPGLYHAATVLQNDKIVFCGANDNAGKFLDKIEPISFDELLTSTSYTKISMWNIYSTKLSSPQFGHTVTAIHDDKMIITGGFTAQDRYSNTFELLDMKKSNKAMTEFLDMELSKNIYSSVVLNNYIYMIGGDDSSNHLSINRIGISEINTDLTSSLSLNHCETNVIKYKYDRRYRAAAVVFDEYIYLFSSSCIRFKSPSSASDSSSFQNWECIAAMNRHSFAAVKNGDRIYIIGGHRSFLNECSYLDSMEIYDPISNTYEDGPRLPIRLVDMTAVSIGSYIVVNGGRSREEKLVDTSLRPAVICTEPYYNTATFLFNTNTQEWRTIHSPSINTPRYNHAATVLQNNKIVVCGGVGTRGLLDTIESIFFDELLYGKRWDRRKEFILLKRLVERGRGYSTGIITERGWKNTKKKKKKKIQRSCVQHLIQKSNDDVFRMVLRFL